MFRRMFWSRPQVPKPSGVAGDWLGPWQFATVFGLLLFACFPNVILGLDAFAYGDSGQFAYPVAYYHRQAFWRGEIPLWNPLSSCGIPFLAQWNTLVLYPLSAIYLVLPLPWSFGVFCLGHMVLAAVGMYWLAFRWTDDRFAAAVAGTIFGFNGLTWCALAWPHILAGLAWMPWVVLLMQRAWTGSSRTVPIAGLVAGLQLLSGGAEVIAQTWIVLGVLLATQLRTRGVARSRLIFRALASAALAVGIAAVQLGPFLELLGHSQRSGGSMSGAMGAIAALPLTGWANFLVPVFRAAPNASGVLAQAGQSWTGSYYVGITTLMLATIAVCRTRSTRVWLLLGLSVFGGLMALGPRGGLYGIAKHILPLLGAIRFPVKFVLLITFAAPLLAALGLKWTVRKNSGKGLPGGATAVGLSLLILFIAVWGSRQPAPGVTSWFIWQNAILRLLFLAAATTCLRLSSNVADAKSHGLLQLGFIALLWFDIVTHSPNLSPTVPATAWEPNAARRNFQWNEGLSAGHARAMVGKEALWKMLTFGSRNPSEELAAHRLTMFMNLNLLDELPKVDGFYSMDLKPYLDVFQRLYFQNSPGNGLMDFLGVAQISNPTNIVDWQARQPYLPLVTGGQSVVFASDAKMLEAVFAADFDPRRTVYLPEAAQSDVRARPGSCSIANVRFSAQRVSCEVSSETPAIVTIAQTFYPCWKSYIDGKRSELWRADHAFQAIQVPAGAHKLEVVYEDRLFQWGIGVSGLSLLVCLGWWWLARRDGAGVVPIEKTDA